MKDYTEFIGKHKGEWAFVVGAGTSLAKIQDLSLIHDHIVIAVNSAIILMPWDDGEEDKRYWLSVDSSVRMWSYWTKVRTSLCYKLIKTSWEKYYSQVPDFYIFPPRPTKSGPINPSDIGCICTSSIPSAIDFAIQIGCSKIFLLGVDHYILPMGISHFWQLLPRQKQPLGPQSPISLQYSIFQKNLTDYRALRVFAESQNAEIYNCNEDSIVTDFQKITFNKAIELCHLQMQRQHGH